MRPRIILILFLITFSLAGQKTDLKELLSYSFPTELIAAKKKGAIAWVENKEGVRNIYYASAPSYTPTQVTKYKEDDGQALSDLHFSADGSSILFVRGGAANRQGEIPNPISNPEGYTREIHTVTISSRKTNHLGAGSSPIPLSNKIIYLHKGAAWSMDLNGENATQLFSIRGSVSNLRLSPDNSKIAFVNGRGDHSFIGVYGLTNKKLTLLSPSIDLDSNPVWSPDGKEIAFLRQAYEEPLLFIPKREAYPFSILVADSNTGVAKLVFQADKGKGSAFRSISAINQLFWTNSDTIIFPWEKNGWTHLYSIPSTGGSPHLITPGNLEVQYVSQSPDRKTLLFNSNQNDIDRQHIWSYSNKLVQLTQGNGIEWLPVIDGVGTIFCLASSATQPADVKQIQNGDLVGVTQEEEYPSKQLVVPEQVIMNAADGVQFHGQLFVPKKLNADSTAPAILFFHGGSRRQMMLGFHHRGYYHYMYAMNQYLASKGYIVLSVNYRSGIGYGMEFREALGYGAGGASEYQDVLAAAKFLESHPKVNPDKIGLWGGSYGGYLTAMGLSRNSDIFKAGVDIHGVYDWNAIIKGFIPSYNKLLLPEFAKLAYDSSPAASMNSWKSPVLLIHGDDDRNVPFNETVVKAQKLRELGVYFEQLVFPDEVHGFLLHKNWIDAFEASSSFFDRKLK